MFTRILLLILFLTPYATQTMEQEQIPQPPIHQSTTEISVQPAVKITVGDSKQEIQLDREVANLFATITNTIGDLGETEPIPLLHVDKATIDIITNLCVAYVNNINTADTHLPSRLKEQLQSARPEQLLQVVSALNYLQAEQSFFDLCIDEIRNLLVTTFITQSLYTNADDPFNFLYTSQNSAVNINNDILSLLIKNIRQDLKKYFQQEAIRKEGAEQTKTCINKTDTFDTGYTVSIFDRMGEYLAYVKGEVEQQNLVMYHITESKVEPVFTLDSTQHIRALTFDYSSAPKLFFVVETRLDDATFINTLFSYDSGQEKPEPQSLHTFSQNHQITGLTCCPQGNSSLLACVGLNDDWQTTVLVFDTRANNIVCQHNIETKPAGHTLIKPHVVFAEPNYLITASPLTNDTAIILWQIVKKSDGFNLQEKQKLTSPGDIISLSTNSHGDYVGIMGQNFNTRKEYVVLYALQNSSLMQIALPAAEELLPAQYPRTCRKLSFVENHTLSLFVPFAGVPCYYYILTHDQLKLLDQLANIAPQPDQLQNNVTLLMWLILYKIYIENKNPSAQDKEMFGRLDKEKQRFLSQFERSKVFMNIHLPPPTNIQKSSKVPVVISNQIPSVQDPIPPQPQPSGWWSRAQSFVNNLYNKFSQFSWRQKAGTACVGAACAVGAYALYKANMLSKVAK